MRNPAGAVSSIALMLLVAWSTCRADVVPMTSASTTGNIGVTGTAGRADQQSTSNPNGISSVALSLGPEAGADGSAVEASAAASADFGTVGVLGSGSGLVTPFAGGFGTQDASAFVTASASWFDVLTPMPTAGQPAGTPVVANLLLDLSFSTELLSFANAGGNFSYSLGAALYNIDPVTGQLSTSVGFDDCFVTSLDPDVTRYLCDIGSTLMAGVPNTGALHPTLQFAPLALPVAILQPFAVGVALTFDGGCSAGPNESQASTCTFDFDGFHTSHTFLQPLGDFILVSGSGHDYSVQVSAPPGGGTPPGSVPEPASITLMMAALLAAAVVVRGTPASRCEAKGPAA